MSLPMVIDVVPGSSPEANCAALIVEACSRARAGDPCVIAAPERTVEGTPAVAWAWFDGDGQRTLHVDVATAASAGTTLRSRQYTFKTDDPPSERCRAAGLIIAGLVSERPNSTVAGADSAASGEEGSGSSAASAAKSAPSRFFAGGTMQVGQGVQGGPGRIGVSGLAGYAIPASPWFASFGLSYTRPWRDPNAGLSMQWLAVGGGGGLSVPVAALDALVRMRLEGFLEWTSAEIHAPGDGSALSGMLVPGTRLALDWIWPARAPLSIVAGVEALLRSHPTLVRVGGDTVVTVPMGGYTGFVGVQTGFGR